jgi:glyoxylase-like metal-dependent hydrolase (beta-lactamase superfamily II)
MDRRMVIAPEAVEIGAASWRIESRLGERNVFEYLLASEDGTELLLIDTGTAGMATDAILPALDRLGFTTSALRFLVVTHPDLDHQGGLAVLRDAAPDAVTACGFADRAMVRHPEQLVYDRYQPYLHEHGLGFGDVDLAWMRANYGGPAEIDLTLVGGERLHVGDRTLEVLSAAGHSAGHLMLYESASGMLFCSDAIHASMCPAVDGSPALCPTYEDVDAYLETIARTESLAPAELHSGHWPVATGSEVGGFLAASREFVDRVDDVLVARLQSPASLADLCGEVERQLGPWGSGTHMLMFVVHGHVRRLLRNNAVELLDPGTRPPRYRARLR